MHLNHGFYDTNILNFTQPDPSRQELNNYAYAQCDPVNNTDPTGLNALQAACQAVGIAGGIVAIASSVGIMAGAGLALGAMVSTGAALNGALAGAAIGTKLSGIGAVGAAGTALSIAEMGCSMLVS